ncbi:MAG TPA: DUF4388 domain-containing protein [Actinomycetes bacterium]
MKLEGSIDAFSLPDIFQLLSFTKKTGGLHLAHEGADGVVFFAGGQVTGASSDSSRQPLARRLVGSGTVSDEALSAAVGAASAGDGVGVVRALLEHQAVDAELLRRAATDQSVDAVFDLLRWESGDFAFVMDEPNPDDVGVTLAVESVLEDTESRRSSWEAVSQLVPSSSAVLAMPVVLAADPQVTREEWSLLALVDGRRSVGDLVDLTGSGQYAVVSTLAALVGRGLLEVRPAPGSQADLDAEDHVAVVVRRQKLLAVLEGEPFVPTPAAVLETDRPETVVPEVVAPEVTGPAEPVEPATLASVESDSESESREIANAAEDEQAGDADADADDERELASASTGTDLSSRLGGAHVPHDVVPPRPEPFLPRRQAEFGESSGSPVSRPMSVQAGPSATLGDVVGATATAPDPQAASVIERDPNVNRSLMLRLIAGVRGL